MHTRTQFYGHKKKHFVAIFVPFLRDSGVREFDFKYCNQLTGITNIIWFAVYHLHPFAHLHHLPATRLGSRMFPQFFKARKRVAERVLAGLLLQIIFAPACGMQHPEEQGKVLRLEGLRWEGLPLHAANH